MQKQQTDCIISLHFFVPCRFVVLSPLSLNPVLTDNAGLILCHKYPEINTLPCTHITRLNMDSESSQAGSTRRRGSSLVQQIINEERIGIRRASPRRMPSDIPEAAHAESPLGYDDEDANPVSSGSDWEMDDIRSDEGLEDDEETGLTVQDRQKRTRRKRRNTMADERIVPDSEISKEEERLASASFMRDAIINCILIGLWYTFSISISVVSRTTQSKSCCLPQQHPSRPNTHAFLVQQMDVLKRQP
jgi:hypothetical protein